MSGPLAGDRQLELDFRGHDYVVSGHSDAVMAVEANGGNALAHDEISSRVSECGVAGVPGRISTIQTAGRWRLGLAWRAT